MTWRTPVACLAAGLALGVWLGRATVAGPPAPTPPGAEVGRPIAGDPPVPTVPTPLLIAVPKPDPARTDRLAEKYGEAWKAAAAQEPVGTPKSVSGLRETSTESEGLPALAEPVELAEKRIGPGPLGDEADVLALLPCPGCEVQILAKWLPPTPKPQPLLRFDRRWFVEGGLGVAETGYAALLGAGYDFARIKRLTVGVRGTAILADDPAGFVGITFRWESR